MKKITICGLILASLLLGSFTVNKDNLNETSRIHSVNGMYYGSGTAYVIYKRDGKEKKVTKYTSGNRTSDEAKQKIYKAFHPTNSNPYSSVGNISYNIKFRD